MTLQSSVLSAVAQAKFALQDLIQDGYVVTRGESTHVPGQAPVYPEFRAKVKIVLTSYKASEIDGDRIRARDVQGLVFPETSVREPEPNDVVEIGSAKYRVIANSKTFAGDKVALSLLQLRLT